MEAGAADLLSPAVLPPPREHHEAPAPDEVDLVGPPGGAGDGDVGEGGGGGEQPGSAAVDFQCRPALSAATVLVREPGGEEEQQETPGETRAAHQGRPRSD